jgi:D-ribose pyranose/furanose isomerase RbsD
LAAGLGGPSYFLGNVGIGTQNLDQKLTVNGSIHSTAVKVDTSIPVPDYLFDLDYHLPSLSDISSYVLKNHHLPEIASASEMEKEGIDLGKMNLILLKKVEELTLYLIDQHKRIAKLETAAKN